MKDAWKLSTTASHPKRKNHVRLMGRVTLIPLRTFTLAFLNGRNL
jgi:hypothetical protein